MRPNLLKYTDYMGKCIAILRHDREYDSDEVIGRLISLRRIDDQIHDTFNAEDSSDLPITDTRISMNLRYLETQLAEWKNEETMENSNKCVLSPCPC